MNLNLELDDPDEEDFRFKDITMIDPSQIIDEKIDFRNDSVLDEFLDNVEQKIFQTSYQQSFKDIFKKVSSDPITTAVEELRSKLSILPKARDLPIEFEGDFQCGNALQIFKK